MSSVQGGAATVREQPQTEPRVDEASRPRGGDAPQVRDTRTPHPTVDERAGPSDIEIARRAYELYLARGGEHGSDLDDWIQAESELRGPDTSPR